MAISDARKMSMTHRRGFSLIEMLTVIAVSAVLFAVAVGLLNAVFQSQRAGRDRLRERMAMDRLARQFREDVHAAAELVNVEVLAGGKSDRRKLPGWRLRQTAGPAIEYWVSDDALFRAERDGDKTLAREEFALPAGAKVEIRLQGPEKPGLARLQISPNSEPSSGVMPPVLVVEGALGLDRRFAAAVETPKTEVPH
jgi:prepilin-type N-terminal cleavage/methylation domain-containing protein